MESRCFRGLRGKRQDGAGLGGAFKSPLSSSEAPSKASPFVAWLPSPLAYFGTLFGRVSVLFCVRDDCFGYRFTTQSLTVDSLPQHNALFSLAFLPVVHDRVSSTRCFPPPPSRFGDTRTTRQDADLLTC